jgi:hypothetical protein
MTASGLSPERVFIQATHAGLIRAEATKKIEPARRAENSVATIACHVVIIPIGIVTKYFGDIGDLIVTKIESDILETIHFNGD